MPEANEIAAVAYQQPAEQQQFYPVLRQRVEKYFRKNQVQASICWEYNLASGPLPHLSFIASAYCAAD